MSSEQGAWHAINDILLWKLGAVEPDAFDLGDAVMSQSLGVYLAPVLRASSASQALGQDERAAFRALLDAQIELNEFLSRSADAFSYDDGIRFVCDGHAGIACWQRSDGATHPGLLDQRLGVAGKEGARVPGSRADSPTAVADFLKLHFAGQPYKSFAVMYLDARNALLAFEDIFRGTLTQTSV